MWVRGLNRQPLIELPAFTPKTVLQACTRIRVCTVHVCECECVLQSKRLIAAIACLVSIKFSTLTYPIIRELYIAVGRRYMIIIYT